MNMQRKQNECKVFEDSVHGHILIPKVFCKEIIDTRIFQRLRRIEQTSMRPLFPSAHHDRFIHSLGVYHVGERLFRSIQENTEKYNPSVFSFIEGKNGEFKPSLFIQKEENGYWSALERTYQLACLLHDCGHAPFSHTLEKYYYNQFLATNGDKLTIPLNVDLIKEYTECVNSKDDIGQKAKTKIISDFKRDLAQCNPKPHELVSSWLVLHKQGFRNIILSEKIKADPLLIARMIIGCKFMDQEHPKKESVNKSEQISNCFISILNGHEIDSDRLDYATRDSWATGLNTVKVNLNRIYSSVYIADKNRESDNSKFIICFRHKCISELQNLLDIKNFTSFWIFNHPKIKYNEDLLIKAVKKLALLLNNEENSDDDVEKYCKIKNGILSSDEKISEIDTLENNAMYRLIDYKNIIEPKEYVAKIGNKTYYDTLFLMSDDDMIHLLKKYFCAKTNTMYSDYHNAYFENSSYANEWFSREQYLTPIWKSYAEYNTRYFTPFMSELELIREFKKSINLLSNAQRKNIKYYNLLLQEDKLNNLVAKIKKYKDKSAVQIILDKLPQHHIQQNLFEYILSSIERAESYYSEKDSYEKILKETASEIIKEIEQDGFSVKPRIDTAKIINIDQLDIKEIRTDAIFVEIKDDIFCYTELNLPLKNQAKKYNFFYVFMPRVFDSAGTKELINKQMEFFDKFRDKFQKQLYILS